MRTPTPVGVRLPWLNKHFTLTNIFLIVLLYFILLLITIIFNIYKDIKIQFIKACNAYKCRENIKILSLT